MADTPYFTDWLREQAGVLTGTQSYGLQAVGFDPTGKVPFQGGTPLTADWLMYQKGQEPNSMEDIRHATYGAQGIEAVLKQEIQNTNPWGDGPDAAYAKFDFEQRLMQNDKTAAREYADLQRRQYGYSHGVLDPTTGQQLMKDSGYTTGDSDRPIMLPVTRTVAPANDLTPVERYKLARYDQRVYQTNEAIGTGDEIGYNPIGMAQLDKGKQDAFVQDDEVDTKKFRVASRASRQSGKGDFSKKTPSGGVQL